jgi:hypothetical protein
MISKAGSHTGEYRLPLVLLKAGHLDEAEI